MTIRDKETLKSYFNRGDVPTEENYADLIDSIFNAAELVLHASAHMYGGDDQIATFTPGAFSIPMSKEDGTLDSSWIPTSLLDHSILSNLNSDDHLQYVNKDIARIISAVHTYNPSLNGAPFVLGEHAQGQTVLGLRADQLNKSIFSGSGLSGGGLLTEDRTLSIDQTSDFLWSGSHAFLSPIIASSIYPYMPDTFDLGSPLNFWRKAYVSELDSVIFAQNTVSIVGGWLMISKGEGYLWEDISDSDVAIMFGQPMTLNDFVLFRSSGKLEYMQISSDLGGNLYGVTRDVDHSGANSWPTGTPYVILGNIGNGRIELNANDTPRMSIIQQGNTYNSQTEILRIGDLLNNWGYLSSAYGAAFGEFGAGKANITIDPTNGIRLRRYTTDVIKLDSTGSYFSSLIQMSGSGAAISIGQTPPVSSISGSGLWIDRTGIFSLKDSIEQARIDAITGDIVAGYDSVFDIADIVKLNKDGLQIKVHEVSAFGGEGYPGIYGIKFLDSGNVGLGRGYIAAAKSDDERIVVIGNAHESNKLASIQFNCGYGLPGDELAYIKIQSGSPSLSNNFVSIYPALKIGDQFLPGVDGWQYANEIWTYVSSGSFRISGDVRKKYKTGRKIRLKQSSSVKYFYVVSSSYSSPNTTVTITAGSDYTLTNTTISENYISSVDPDDFPTYFNWTPTLTGFSVAPGSSVYRFTIFGTRFEGVIHQGTDGTSNLNSLNISLPITAKSGGSWGGANGIAINNGVALTVASRWYIGGGNNYAQFMTDMYTGAWATINGKRVRAIVSCEI